MKRKRSELAKILHYLDMYGLKKQLSGCRPLSSLGLIMLHFVYSGAEKRTSLLLEVGLKQFVYATMSKRTIGGSVKLSERRHESSMTNVAWHPNNIFLATTSTDGKCLVFSTFIKGVDTRDPASSSDSKFGEQMMQLDLSFSWTFGMKWSPSGNTLAYVGHSSIIYFVDDVGPSPSAQSVAFRDLPLRDVLFVSERLVIAVGFDCNPMVFTADEMGSWSFLRFLEEKKAIPSNAKYSTQLSEKFGNLYNRQPRYGINKGTVETSRTHGTTAHENCIMSIVSLKKEGHTATTSFSTSGLDGKVVIWDLQQQEDLHEFF